MFKDQVINEAKKLAGPEQMEVAITILLNVMEKSGVSKSEKILVEELEYTLKRLKGEQ